MDELDLWEVPLWLTNKFGREEYELTKEVLKLMFYQRKSEPNTQDFVHLIIKSVYYIKYTIINSGYARFQHTKDSFNLKTFYLPIKKFLNSKIDVMCN